MIDFYGFITTMSWRVGIALEELTGRSFPEIVRSAVFERLGMADSGFWALDAVVPDLAVGYLPPAEGAAAGSPEASWRTNVYAVPAMGGPDGGVQATVADLVRLLDGLTGRGSPGGGFLSPPVRAARANRALGPGMYGTVPAACSWPL